MHWYCDFYNGERSPDDERQIDRWMKTAGPKSRFRRMLINMIKRKNSKYDDFSISHSVKKVKSRTSRLSLSLSLHSLY